MRNNLNKFYMKFIVAFIFCFLAINSPCYSVERLPNHLINLQSQEGMKLFKRNVNNNAIKLLTHFTTQKTVTYCGIASATMVLNASIIDAPIDSPSIPYNYFTQENFFNDKVKQI